MTTTKLANGQEMLNNAPIGIEKIDRGCYVIFRVMFGKSIYVTENVTRYGKDTRDVRYFSSRAKALSHAQQLAGFYLARRIFSA